MCCGFGDTKEREVVPSATFLLTKFRFLKFEISKKIDPGTGGDADHGNRKNNFAPNNSG